MNQVMRDFLMLLNREDIRYLTLSEKIVQAVFRGENVESILVYLTFEAEGRDVALRIPQILRVPPAQREKMYRTCSEFNRNFRWLRFYVDEQNELCASTDSMLLETTGARDCYEIMMRAVCLVDDIYPRLQ